MKTIDTKELAQVTGGVEMPAWLKNLGEQIGIVKPPPIIMKPCPAGEFCLHGDRK